MDQFLADGWRPMEGVSSDFLINDSGKVLNLKYRQVQPVHYDHSGYYQVNLKDSDGFKIVRPIHRLVALTFLKRPQRLSEYPYEVLSVTHLDGNKRNNSVVNLEWMTAEELAAHLRELGVYKNECPVIGKNTQGDFIRFRSVSAAARWIGIHQNLLNRHLNSQVAGCIQHNGWVFLFDEKNKQWPDVVFPETEHLKLSRRADTIVTREGDKTIHVFNSVVEAARLLGLNIVGLRNHIARRGLDEPFDGYRFHALDDFQWEVEKQTP